MRLLSNLRLVSCAFVNVNAEDVPAMYEQSEPNGPNGGSEAKNSSEFVIPRVSWHCVAL